MLQIKIKKLQISTSRHIPANKTLDFSYSIFMYTFP